jgi:hypothetical protein
MQFFFSGPKVGYFLNRGYIEFLPKSDDQINYSCQPKQEGPIHIVHPPVNFPKCSSTLTAEVRILNVFWIWNNVWQKKTGFENMILLTLLSIYVMGILIREEIQSKGIS